METGDRSGLCSSCRYSQSCTYLKSLTMPVTQCEEFEGFFPEPGDDAREGLCVTCDNRATCMFPRPAGGIWHCEEYR